MIDNNIKIRALWFIKHEIERVLRNLESGVINKDYAIGSLNTLFNVSSGIEDTKHMQAICRIIAHIRSTNFYFQINKLYINNYFHESNNAAEEKKEKPRLAPPLEKITR